MQTYKSFTCNLFITYLMVFNNDTSFIIHGVYSSCNLFTLWIVDSFTENLGKIRRTSGVRLGAYCCHHTRDTQKAIPAKIEFWFSVRTVIFSKWSTRLAIIRLDSSFCFGAMRIIRISLRYTIHIWQLLIRLIVWQLWTLQPVNSPLRRCIWRIMAKVGFGSI